MGNGYFILLWDAWGAGLVMVNPRLYTYGQDCYGNLCNWFPCEGEVPSEAEARRMHNLTLAPFVRVIPG